MCAFLNSNDPIMSRTKTVQPWRWPTQDLPREVSSGFCRCSALFEPCPSPNLLVLCGDDLALSSHSKAAALRVGFGKATLLFRSESSINKINKSRDLAAGNIGLTQLQTHLAMLHQVWYFLCKCNMIEVLMLSDRCCWESWEHGLTKRLRHRHTARLIADACVSCNIAAEVTAAIQVLVAIYTHTIQ